MSPNLRGALLMAASMAFFTMNDVFVKLLSGDLYLFQIIFLRGILTTTLLIGVAFAFRQVTFHVPRGDWAPLAGRTICEIGAAVFFLAALVNMPIANATAILAALPLSVTLAAAVFLKEPLGWRRMSAVLVGFAGVMLIVQPGTDGFNAFSLSAMLAAIGGVIERHLISIGFIDGEGMGLKTDPRAEVVNLGRPAGPACPACGQYEMRMLEGCLTCANCGHSKCSG